MLRSSFFEFSDGPEFVRTHPSSGPFQISALTTNRAGVFQCAIVT